MFTYDDTLVRQTRLAAGIDHCASRGTVYALRELVRGGKIYDPLSPDRTLTTSRTSSPDRRVLIYAVEANFDINVGFDGVRGQPDAVKHETLFHNADVRAAGELTVSEGIIVDVNDLSGSYGTAGKLEMDIRFAEALLLALDRSSAPLRDSVRSLLRERAAGR